MAPPRRTAPPGHCRRLALTPRELEVLAAVVTTGSEKAAAHRLGMAPPTVKRHLANARAKAGVDNTTQLVRLYADELPLPNGMAQTDE